MGAYGSVASENWRMGFSGSVWHYAHGWKYIILVVLVQVGEWGISRATASVCRRACARSPKEAMIKSGFRKAAVFGERTPGPETEIRPLPALLRLYSGLFALPLPLFCLKPGKWAH